MSLQASHWALLMVFVIPTEPFLHVAEGEAESGVYQTGRAYSILHLWDGDGFVESLDVWGGQAKRWPSESVNGKEQVLTFPDGILGRLMPAKVLVNYDAKQFGAVLTSNDKI